VTRAPCPALAALALATALGCSALASVPPPNHPLASPEECSSSHGPFVIDSIAAANAGGLAAILLAAAAIEYGQDTDTVVPSWDARPLNSSRGLLVAGGLSVAATVALIRSAQYGLDSARACQGARTELYSRNPGPYPSSTGEPLWPPAPAPPRASAPWPAR
jgi:hypothetical protein